jgi:hypothetical protein
MDTTATAKGQLHHHFHGNYSASIGLLFASDEYAALALPKLGAGWRIAANDTRVLVWHGAGDALKACEAVLVGFGADERKIGSLKFSIDRGEAFEISVPVHCSHPDQLSLL